MKKTILALALGVATLVPSLAFAVPVTPGTRAVHSYTRGNGTQVGSYVRRASSNGRAAVNVRGSVRNNANGTQSLVRPHLRNAPSGGTAAAN